MHVGYFLNYRRKPSGHLIFGPTMTHGEIDDLYRWGFHFGMLGGHTTQ